jgi:hypothetical protein
LTFATTPGKKNFLVFKNNKYINVHTKNIAFFYVKAELSKIMCLVNPVFPSKEKLLVPREKVSEFLNWLDNR